MKSKATIYRWIKKGVLSQTRVGVPKAEIDRVKATFEFDQGVIKLLCKAHKAHKIKPTSGERAYRRLCARLNIETRAPIKSDEKRVAIMETLSRPPGDCRMRVSSVRHASDHHGLRSRGIRGR
jgi:hypothetical protein